MNALNELLSNLRINGSVYFCGFLRPPWTIEHDDEQRAVFHLVRRGRCQLEIDNKRYDLLPGDFAFVSPNIDHKVTACGSDAQDTLLLCGFGWFKVGENDLIFRDVPPYIVIRQERLQELPWMHRTLEHVSAEYMSEAPGSEVTVNKLTEILLVQLLRTNFGEKRDVGIIAAMRDKRLVQALDEVHNDLSRSWTIESVASKANMSRSGFAKVFSQVMEMVFFEYLTNIRMMRARRLLKETRKSVDEIGQQVCYQSEMSFIKAFKKYEGKTPRAARFENSDLA